MPQQATVTWHDPAEVYPQIVGLDGLGYVLAVRDRIVPPDPLMESLGIRLVEVAPGTVAVVCTPTGAHLNHAGTVHGGMLSTLLDCATGFAVHTTLPVNTTAPHVSVSYQFMRAGRKGIELRCTGEVIRKGRRLGHVRGEIHDATGRLLATGETTHAVVSEETVRSAATST